MDGITVIDRALKVESAKTAADSRGGKGGNPLSAAQLQQIQQLQLMQQQQQQLAEQVALMRVQQKINPAGNPPGGLCCSEYYSRTGET